MTYADEAFRVHNVEDEQTLHEVLIRTFRKIEEAVASLHETPA